MANELAAKRYAQAAFEVAREEGDLPAWSEALARIAHFMSEGDAARALENTRMPQDLKHQLIEAGLGDLPATRWPRRRYGPCAAIASMSPASSPSAPTASGAPPVGAAYLTAPMS